ncbi:MAG: permease [Treponemataceae bacterium]
MIEKLQTEVSFLWYYCAIMIEQILPYWAFGVLLGSVISVFGKLKITALFERLFTPKMHKAMPFGLLLLSKTATYLGASLLGILSPLCMYGTIPIAASFSQKGIKDDILASFMVSSILLNPQLLMYTFILGKTMVIIRFTTALLCGFFAGICIKIFFKEKSFFNFSPLTQEINRDTEKNITKRLLFNIGRNIKITFPYFAIGILLTAMYQRYIPQSFVSSLFGKEHKAFGVLFAATLAVPLYMCGGGTIPLLWEWLHRGMTSGSASAFMITGASTKFTNLGAVKIVLGTKHFLYYLLYIMIFALISGLIINLF